mmetsp:Transcript_15167/g.43333  ORF Transcript_15167/g.43333 Transcript_15167/m.43333 type:complete len:201 (+) Transcript_15167:167-769(+)
MLANTRSRTVFGLQHKYSNEYVERSSGSPLGSFEAQILELRRTGDVPIIKRKPSAARLLGGSGGAEGSGRATLRSSMSCSSLEAARSLAVNAAPEEEDGSWSPGRLSTSGHMAGALRRSCMRKAPLAELKDPRRLGDGRPRLPERAAAFSALDVATPAVELDCAPRGSPGGVAHGFLSTTASSALLEAALADGPQGDVFL